MSPDEYRLHSSYELVKYPCGISAGMRLRIKRDIHIYHEDKPTDEVYPSGEIWTVLRGVVNQPSIVWLRQADGATHTWDDSDILETFEKVE